MPFAEDVRAGLTAQPKTLPPKYFYDELGSALFEAITLLPEYYLTRAESDILTAHADEVVARAAPAELVELGSGSATKTRLVIEASLRLKPALAYSAVDISESALEGTAKALQAQYPSLTVRSYQGEYYEGLRKLALDGHPRPRGRTLVLFLGSNIGNFEPPEALRFLRAIRAALTNEDTLLLGTDLKKDRAQLVAAYDDSIGLTAAFNLNILARINRELGGHFDLRTFAHQARYDELAGRIEMHLASRVAQTVSIDNLQLQVSFAVGETIHTESSYKFSRTDVDHLAREAGFTLEHSWTDSNARFGCNLLRCVPSV